MTKSDYKNIQVFIEQREGIIQPVSFELLGEARRLADELKEKVVAIFPCHGLADQAQMLIEYGADEVLIMDAPELKDYITEEYTQAVCNLILTTKPSIVLIGASTIGRDLGPRLSARIGTGLTADCTRLEISEEGELMMTRPAFGGNLMATIMCTEHRPQMSTVRPGVMKRIPRDASRHGEVCSYTPEFDRSKIKVQLLETVHADKDLVDITEAKILISGGRGVGSQAGFERLTELASTIKAEVATSRAMVDAGIMPHDRQVGQTGKTVRPDLYLACGISGAIQHLAGMEESELIIAINKDKYAPIFQVADLGIVGDVHKIIPLLTERLKKEMAK